MNITTGTVGYLIHEYQTTPNGPWGQDLWVESPTSPGYWIKNPTGEGASDETIDYKLQGLQALKDHIESQQA